MKYFWTACLGTGSSLRRRWPRWWFSAWDPPAQCGQTPSAAWTRPAQSPWLWEWCESCCHDPSWRKYFENCWLNWTYILYWYSVIFQVEKSQVGNFSSGKVSSGKLSSQKIHKSENFQVRKLSSQKNHKSENSQVRKVTSQKSFFQENLQVRKVSCQKTYKFLVKKFLGANVTL